jgi:Secretion system C-terminal sorting domain
MKKLYVLLGICCCVTVTKAQLFIQTGATITTADSNSYITLQDMNLINNGTINQTKGGFLFTGSNNNTISGSSTSTFNKFEIAKASGKKITLQQNININSLVAFSGGLIDLNSNNIALLPNAYLLDESETSRITGVSGGFVTVGQATVNGPNALNIGLVGATITSAQNLGSLQISRTHKPAVNPANPLFTGVQRSYIITPQNNTALNATLKFNYFDAELNGKDENTLVLWRSVDGINWSNFGFDSRNTVDNYVTKNSIAAFSIWTLSDAVNVLPIKLISFAAVCNNGVTTLKWKTGEEEPGSKFNIEKSYDGANFITIGTQAAIGSGSNSYQFIDNQPATNMGSNVFYRLKVIDAGASFSYSPVFSGNCNEATMPMQIYPNPAQHYTNIKISVRQKQQAQLLVYSVAGQMVFTADYTLQTGTNNFTIPLTNLASGTYAVKVTLSSGQKLNGSFVKN